MIAVSTDIGVLDDDPIDGELASVIDEDEDEGEDKDDELD